MISILEAAELFGALITLIMVTIVLQTVTVRLAGSGMCQMFALAADSSSGACALVKLLKGLLIRIEILIIEMAPA